MAISQLINLILVIQTALENPLFLEVIPKLTTECTRLVVQNVKTLSI